MSKPDLFEQDGNYWVRITLPNGHIVAKDTEYQVCSVYFRKANREAQNIIKQEMKNFHSPTSNVDVVELQSNWKKHPRSRLENEMDLIHIRNKTIYIDFRYTCSKTGKRKRFRKSTCLENNRSNRIKAQQMALDELDALSHSNPDQTKPKPPSLPQDKNKQVQVGTKKKIISGKARLQRQQEREADRISLASVETLNDFVEYYYTRKKYIQLTKKSKRTYNTYLEHYILPYFGHVPLQDIDSDLIEDFEIDQTEKGLSSKFIKDTIGILRMLLNFAVAKRKLAYCPHFTVSAKIKKKKPKYLTPAERDIFLAYLAENEALYFPIIQFTAFTGTRMGEARSLTWGDVDFDQDNPSIRIHRTLDIDGEFKGTKTNQERRIPLHPIVFRSLKELWLNTPLKEKDDFIFLNTKNNPHSPTTLHKVVVRGSIESGVPRISYHALRHTFATIITNKYGVAKACRLLGHSDIKTTMIYYHGDQEVLREAIEGQ